MKILACLGDDGVHGPDRPVGGEHDDDGATAPFGIGQRVEEPPERGIDGLKRGGGLHGPEDPWGRAGRTVFASEKIERTGVTAEERVVTGLERTPVVRNTIWHSPEDRMQPAAMADDR